jgi:hypothetical protein
MAAAIEFARVMGCRINLHHEHLKGLWDTGKEFVGEMRTAGGWVSFKDVVATEVLCPICEHWMVAAHAIVPCGHLFCKECLAGWLDRNSTCPLCRYEHPSGLQLQSIWVSRYHDLHQGFAADYIWYYTVRWTPEVDGSG